jgi:integrase
VFHNPDTLKPYVNIDYDIKKALTATRIRDFRFHDLLHDFASLAMMSGKIEVAALSNLLGHTNLKQMMKYARFAHDYLKKAAYVMDEVYRAKTDTRVTQTPVIRKTSI